MAELTRDDIKGELEKLEVEFNPREKSDKLLAMLNTMTGEEHTFKGAEKPEAAPAGPNVTTTASVNAGTTTPAPVQASTPTAPAAEDPEATTRCIIHSNDRENIEKMFEGNLNGTPVRVKLGEEIDFPNKYKQLIKNAVVETNVPLYDEDGLPNGKYKEIRTPRYIIEVV